MATPKPSSQERLERALQWDQMARSCNNRADANRFRKLAHQERELAQRAERFDALNEVSTAGLTLDQQLDDPRRGQAEHINRRTR